MIISIFIPTFTVSLASYTWLSYLVIWSPGISVIISILIIHGKEGLNLYLHRIISWNASWKWSIFIVLFIIIQNILASIITDLCGGGALWSIQMIIPQFIIGAFLTMTEALPQLQQRFTGWQSTLILGLIWATWHVLALFIESIMAGAIVGDITAVIFTLYLDILITSFIMTIIYNATNGSVPLMMMYHWLMNIAYPWESRAGINIFQDIIGIIVLIGMSVFLFKTYIKDDNLIRDVLRPSNSIKRI